MKTFHLLTLGLLCTSTAWSQNYFVSFVDKDTSVVAIATQQLSQKSLDRRINQSIAIDFSDFPVHQPYLDSIQKVADSTLYLSRWMNGVLVQSTDPDFKSTIETIDFVSYVHDLSSTSIGGLNEVDTLSYGTAWQNVNLVGAEKFHLRGNTGQGKFIAVFDGGFEGLSTIPNLGIEPPLSYDFVRKSTYVDDFTDHGFKVGSIIAADLTNQYIGLAPGSELALFITEDVGSETVLEEYLWLIAAERADSLGVDIINSSLGYYAYDNDQTSHIFDELDGETAVITKAANLAVEKGMLVVNSSGNSNQTFDWPYIAFPADGKNVLSVGALNADGSVANFSSRGPINASFQKPEVVALGVQVPVIDRNGNFTTSSGTSFSSPIIAGLAALVWNEFPELTALQLRQKLIENSTDYLNPTVEKGYGIPTFSILTGLEREVNNPEIKEVYYLTVEGKKTAFPLISGLYFKQTIYVNDTRSTEKIFFER